MGAYIMCKPHDAESPPKLIRLSCIHPQACLSLCDPGDYSPPGSSVHGVLQARVLEWVAIPFSRGSSRDLPGIEPGFSALQVEGVK